MTTYAYDALDRLVKVTQPDPDGAGVQTSPVTQYQYDKAGNLRFETDPLGHVTEYRYDARNWLVKIIAADPDGAGSQTSPVTNFTYDDAGQLISETDPLGNVTTREYDNLGRLKKVTAPDPDGAGPQLSSLTTFTYDAVGNLLTVTDALNQTTTYQYDAHNNRTKIIEAELGETVFTFDDAGNLLTLTDPELNATSWVYDGLDRVIEVTNELNATRYFAYNAVGNLTRRTDRNGRVTEYDYDNLHRLTAERWMNGATAVRTLSYGYDANGQLLSASDPAAAYTYTYDNLGRTTTVLHDLAALSFNVDVTSTYNAASDRTQMKATVGGAADFVNDYAYNNLHRMTQVKQHGVTGGNAVAEKRVDFGYNALSQFSTINRYEDLAGTENVANSTFTYDAASRLTSLSHAQGAITLASYAWGYDRANRVTSFTNNLYAAESATYSYDATDQLTIADRSGTTSDESYTYDANGNRANAGYSTGANNRLLSDGTYNYEYDNEGNRTKETNIATGAVREFTWDHRNRLIKITERASAAGAATKVVEYKYDVFDLRVEKNVDVNADGVFDEGTRWITDGADVVLAFDKNGAVTNRYLHGPAIDQILADENTLGEVLWPLTDNQGTVRDVADYNATTNATTVANHITYTVFGAIQSQTNPGVNTAYAYTGQEWDADAKQYYYNARWYDADTGVFTSEDPIYDDYRNPHRYVGNSPTNFTDPSGLESEGGIVDRLERAFNRPIYTPIPSWARGKITSLPFMGCPEDWDGSPDHPNTTTPAELISEGQQMLLEATLAFLPFAPVAQGTARAASTASSAARAARAASGYADEAGQVARAASAPIAPSRATGQIAEQISGPSQRLAGQIDEIARRRGLGVDPASGRYRILEEQAALRLEQRVGRLRRDPSGTGDWIDAAGCTYDAVGPVPTAHIDTGSFINQINRHLNKQGLDKVVLDLTGFNSAQRSSVFDHLRTLDPSQLRRILIQRAR